MAYPEKWRDTCDPFQLPFRIFRLQEVLGYPHGRNDVFHVRGTLNGDAVTAYCKVARHPDSALEHEACVLSQLDAACYPKVLEIGAHPISFVLTQDLPGNRLSQLVGNNENLQSLSYMEAYGAALAKLHQLTPSVPEQTERKFRIRPSAELLAKVGLPELDAYFSEVPSCGQRVFCHGDFHYANLLWGNYQISAILDFELSGYGDRDFDIAWTLFLRPGQTFLKTEEEFHAFLNGYQSCGVCNVNAIRYYIAQCYVYFLDMCRDDTGYCAYIRSWIAKHCGPVDDIQL